MRRKFVGGEAPEHPVRRWGELWALVNAAGSPTYSRVYIHGEAGMGKTHLMEEVASRAKGKVKYLSVPRLRSGELVDLLAELPQLGPEVALLIVDDIDRTELAHPEETAARLRERSDLAVFLTSRDDNVHVSWYRAMGSGARSFWLRELSYRSAREMLAKMGVMGPAVNGALGEYGGNPGKLLTWAAGGDPSQLDARMSSLATVLSPDGRPIDAGDPGFRLIEMEARDAGERLVRALAERPELMYELSSRKFEEAVAELWARSGYEVELTRASRDGGVDFYAYQKAPFGSFLTVVDCKRYRPDRPVEVGLVKSLYGTTLDSNASAGVIATTSYFTAGAKSFQEERKHRVGFQDFVSLREMLKASLGELPRYSVEQIESD